MNGASDWDEDDRPHVPERARKKSDVARCGQCRFTSGLQNAVPQLTCSEHDSPDETTCGDPS